MLALERMEKIARWEACSESSAEFRAAAAHIDAELRAETRYGLVAETDLDEGRVTGKLACETIAINASETGSIASGDDMGQVSDTDTYESSFIDDEDVSTQAGSDSSVEISSTVSSVSSNSSVMYTSDVANDDVEVHAEAFQAMATCTDSNDSLRARNDEETMSMLLELPGAESTSVNPEHLDLSSPPSAWPGNFPLNVDVFYSHDGVDDINNIHATN